MRDIGEIREDLRARKSLKTLERLRSTNTNLIHQISGFYGELKRDGADEKKLMKALRAAIEVKDLLDDVEKTLK